MRPVEPIVSKDGGIMTGQDLIDAGYKKYDGTAAALKHADCYYAKMLRDEKGKKFQIVFYYYDWRKPEDTFPHLESFQPEVQLRDEDFCVDISLHSRQEQSVMDVEAYYEAQWIHHGRPYYELFGRSC